MTRKKSLLVQPVKGSVFAACLCAAYQVHAADAQVVMTCDQHTQLALVSEPKALNMRHYANGNVIVAVVDDGRDDVAAALSLVVISPPLSSAGQRQCRRVSLTEANGYAALVLDQAQASYDPASGLTVVVPALAFGSPDALGDKIDLAVTINQASGMITPVETPTTQ